MNLGVFFGAGAEIGYGLPSGGQFAIDLFRKDPTEYKNKLRKTLENIEVLSVYANQWLPDGYRTKAIYAFGKNEFSSLIESSLEYKRGKIIELLSDFDGFFVKSLNDLNIKEADLRKAFKNEAGISLGSVLYSQKIKLNKTLSSNVTLFSSEFYSAILELLKNKKGNDDLKRYAVSFLQLLVGSYGQELVKNLNEELFESTPDDLPIFDDLYGMFKLEFNRIGSTALELLLSEKRQFSSDLKTSSVNEVFCSALQKTLENLFTYVLDYQKLIDEHFRYLFSPKTEWAKFTRMVIFLEIARDYIIERKPLTLPPQGYYHDLLNASAKNITINTIGTANYNNLLSDIVPLLSKTIIHLNGSVNDFYNPYKNSVSTIDDPSVLQDQIHVPFMLTQSGLKPLTSVEMSRRYVNLFDSFSKSDAIAIVGFGFNSDDTHINGLFRELVEVYNKKLFIIGIGDSFSLQKSVIRKLRIDKNEDNVQVITVDAMTRMDNNTLWIDIVKASV